MLRERVGSIFLLTMADDAYQTQLPASRSPSPEPQFQQERNAAPQRRRRPEKPRREVTQQFELPLMQPETNRAVGDPVGGALGQVGQIAQGVTQAAPAAGGGPGKDTLKLRLDLNLDVDVQIKARVHGDVTLSLL
jgi:hypothetical protein